MNQPINHRKTVKHFDIPGHFRELTFSCYQRKQLLTSDNWREMLSHSLDQALEHHRYQLSAFVYMPEHVHLLVFPRKEASGIAELLRAIKRPYSYRIKQQLVKESSLLLEELTIRQRPGVMTFRFWQEGGGYDRNLTSTDAVLEAIDYIHRNPVRRGLCQRAIDWRWSSAGHYFADDEIVDSALPKIHSLPSEWLTGGGVQTS